MRTTITILLALPLAGCELGDLHWLDILVHDGAFSADGSLHGRFHGAHDREAGGIFNRNGWLGAFGVSR